MRNPFRFRSGDCGVPTCKGRRVRSGLGMSAWCRDHTDAIWAHTDGPPGEVGDRGRELAARIGARRWALKAEIDAEMERRHVEVIEAILDQDDFTREANRFCWDHSRMAFPRGIDLGPRVDELLALRGPLPCPKCGHVEGEPSYDPPPPPVRIECDHL